MKLKRIISALTAVAVMSSSLLTQIPAQAEEPVVANNTPVSITGTNSFGTMMASDLQNGMDFNDINTGYSISTITLNDDMTGTAVINAVKDCSVIIAVYDDDGKNLYDSYEFDAEAGSKEYDIHLKSSAIGEYYILRGFIVDPTTLAPLSKCWEDNSHTRKWSEFYEKTTDDFDSKQVFNFDADKTDNFIVFRSNVKRIISDGVHNIVDSADDTNRVFTFSNIDENISSLKTGDMFSYEYKNNGLILAKVRSISVSDGKAVINGAAITSEDFFSFIKINFEQEQEQEQKQKSEYTTVTREMLAAPNAADDKDGDSSAFNTCLKSLPTKFGADVLFYFKGDTEEKKFVPRLAGEYYVGDQKFSYGLVQKNKDNKSSNQFEFACAGEDGSSFGFNAEEGTMKYEKDGWSVSNEDMLKFINGDEEMNKAFNEMDSKLSKAGTIQEFENDWSKTKSLDVEKGGDVDKKLSLKVLAKAGLHFTDFKLRYNGSDDTGWYSSIDFNYSVDFKCAIDLEGEVEIPLVEVFIPQLELVGIHLGISVSITINGSISASMNLTISGGYHFFWDRDNGRRFNCDYNGTKFASELSGEIEVGVKFAAEFSLLYKVIDVELSATPTISVSVTVGGKNHNEENHQCSNCIYGNLTGRVKLGIDASVIFGLIGYSNEWTVAEIRIVDYHWSDDESKHASCKNKTRIDNFVFDICPSMNYELTIMPYISSLYSSDYNVIAPDINIPAPEIFYYEHPDSPKTESAIYTLLDHSSAETNDDGFYAFKEVAKPETMYIPDIQYNGYRNQYEWMYFEKTNFDLGVFLKRLWLDNELEKKQYYNQSDLEDGEIVNYPIILVETNSIQQISIKNRKTGLPITSGTVYVTYYPDNNSEQAILNAEKNGIASHTQFSFENGNAKWFIPYGIFSSRFTDEKHNHCFLNVVPDCTDGEAGFEAYNVYHRLDPDKTLEIELVPLATYEQAVLRFVDVNEEPIASRKIELTISMPNGDPIREYTASSTITDANGEVKIKVPYEKELGRDYFISATIDNGKQSDLMTINPDIVRIDSTTAKNGKVTVPIDGTSTKIIMLTKEGEAPDLNGQRITDIAMGYSHSAAITEDGYLYTWGSNDKGQLGDGTTTSSSTPILIPLDGKKAVSVSAGTEFTAAITEDGSLYMWGANDRGQLGDGTNTNSSIPRLTNVDGKNVKAVSLGYLHTAAITDDGSLYTWGANGKGQLGDGGTSAKSTPVQITLGSGESVTKVSAGNYHTAAVTENGSLYVWGANDFSQIGDSSASFNVKTPTLISLDGKKAIDVSLGALHSAALTEDGSVYMWGCNDNGQLGDGTTVERDTPVLVNIGSPVKAIALGADHSAAINENGTLYMWGCNDAGQLGNGTTDDANVPVAVDLGENTAVKLAFGYKHSAVINNDRLMYLWGDNSKGALGSDSLGDSTKPNLVIIEKLKNTEVSSMMLASGPASEITRTVSGLEPGALYNFYANDASGELIFVDQRIADSNGDITESFASDIPDPICTAVKFIFTDIAAAIIGIGDEYYDGTVKTVLPTVTLNGSQLVPGKDFMIIGCNSSKEIGSHTLIVVGTGDYYGYNSAQWTILPANSRINGISMKKLPDKISYLPETSLDVSGALINIDFSDGSSAVEAVYDDMVSGFTGTPGTNHITVTYNGMTTGFDVTVQEPEITIPAVTISDIKLSALPVKTEYKPGEELDMSGAELTLIYTDNNSIIIPATADMVSGFDDQKPGEQTLTVNYKGKTATFKITVAEKENSEPSDIKPGTSGSGSSGGSGGSGKYKPDIPIEPMISADFQNRTNGEKSTVSFELISEDNTIKLSTVLKSSSIGHWANLMKQEDGKTVFVSAVKVQSDGSVKLAYSKADKYILIVDDITYMAGDANNDLLVNALDASEILKLVTGYVSFDDDKLETMDANGDGAVNTLDASSILKRVAGLIA